MFSYEKHFSSEIKDSIINDYELLLSMYQKDDIKELKNNEEELKFILRINYLINIQTSEVIESINRLKLKQVKIENNELFIPYWMQFNYNNKNNNLEYVFYIYWIKDNNDLINKIKQEMQDIEEPFIYNAIDIIKNNLEESLNEANIVSFLNELKLNNTQNLSLENALFTITKANKDCPDFLYEEKEELINTNTSKEISKEKKRNKFQK